MFVQIAWFLLLFQIATKQSCSPLYTRLFYNPSPAPQLKVDMIVMFNTLSPCSDSYVQVTYLNSEDEFKCTSELISIQGPIVPYLQQYVHKCEIEIDSASKVSQFSYVIMPTQENTPNLVELASEALPFRIIVLANTNMLDNDGYIPFAKAFQTLMERRQEELRINEGDNHYRINGIILNGDFSQTFTGKKGQNFNKIMRMLSQYSHKWPLLINLGAEQVSGDANIDLIKKNFILGGIAGDGSTGMQGFSFARKANIAILQTSSEYYSQKDERSAYFNTTLSKLDSFFANNQQNGNQFSIVLNRFPLFCSNSEDPNSPYNCQKGSQRLNALKTQLSSPSAYPPADLYISSFLNNYERDYPFPSGKFMTLEQSRYKRGDFININEGAGGVGLSDPIAKTQKIFTAFRDFGKAGFGILTVKGDGELRKKNQTAIIQKQVAARKIYDSFSHKSAMRLSHKVETGVLDEQYLQSEDLSELDLFLLNYKHVILSQDGELVVEDVFRIVSDPQVTTQRHQLKAQ